MRPVAFGESACSTEVEHQRSAAGRKTWRQEEVWSRRNTSSSSEARRVGNSRHPRLSLSCNRISW